MEHSDKPGAVALVEPVEGWALHTRHGTLRCDASPDGRLVRLADVVRWFVEKHELPFAVAVEKVMAGITTETIQDFFYLDGDDGGYATSVMVPSAFDQFLPYPLGREDDTEEEKKVYHLQRLRNSWLLPAWELSRFDAEFNSETQTPFEYLDAKKGGSSIYAIRMSLAHRLWGWGAVAQASKAASLEPSQVQTFAELVAYRKLGESLPATNRPLWVASHVELLASELRRRKAASVGRGFKAEIARELGFTGGNPGAALNPILTRFGFTIDGERIPGAAVAADMACRLVGNS